MEPDLTLDAAKAVVATKTAPKVTEESIKAKIENVQYVYVNTITICLILMKNGFVVDGLSAPASKANYDARVGERFAYNNAFAKLWPLEGYLLREQLATLPQPSEPTV